MKTTTNRGFIKVGSIRVAIFLYKIPNGWTCSIELCNGKTLSMVDIPLDVEIDESLKVRALGQDHPGMDKLPLPSPMKILSLVGNELVSQLRESQPSVEWKILNWKESLPLEETYGNVLSDSSRLEANRKFLWILTGEIHSTGRVMLLAVKHDSHCEVRSKEISPNPHGYGRIVATLYPERP